MFYSIPYNNDLSLINEIDFDDALIFYGQMSNEQFGGGRADLNDDTEKEFSEAIKLLTKKGKSFNYIINGSNYLNQEFGMDMKRLFHKKIEYLLELGVSMITLSNPFLIAFSKKYFPQLKISLSVINNVDNLKTALMWESMGVNHITLSKNVNRNFELLKAIRDNSNMELQLLANDPCLPGCNLHSYHNQTTCNSSLNIFDIPKNKASYCTSMCRATVLRDPTNIIRANWIRPEDIPIYENVGINYIKLVDRKQSTEWILRVVKAYINQSYKGNLADLMSFFELDKSDGTKSEEGTLDLLKQKDIDYISIPLEKKKLFRFKPYIDNSELNGFINRFLKGNCNGIACKNCNYCKSYADKALRDIKNGDLVAHNINMYLEHLMKI